MEVLFRQLLASKNSLLALLMIQNFEWKNEKFMKQFSSII